MTETCDEAVNGGCRAMNLRVLEGQRAIVTGANSGIGEGVAKGLAEAGAKVVVNYVTGAGASRASGGRDPPRPAARPSPSSADVSKEDQVQAMFQQAIDAWGSVDILVNNAGLQRDAPLHEMSLKDWQFVIDVNLTGQFLCAREAVREFLRRGVDAGALRGRRARSSACPRCTTSSPGPGTPTTRPPRAACRC